MTQTDQMLQNSETRIRADVPVAAAAIPSLGASSGRRNTAIVTPFLVIISSTLFLAMALVRTPHGGGFGQFLLQQAANFGPSTLDGQWWRLFTSIFVHLGWLHVAVNMWCLWDLGSFAERIYGRTLLLTIYLATGAAGAMFSLVWHPFAIEAGASGAIFGIAGALLSSIWLDGHEFPRDASRMVLLSVAAFAGYNLLVGFSGSGFGNAAHIGGLLSGLMLGVILARTRNVAAIIAASVVLLGAGYLFVARTESYIVPAERGRKAFMAGQMDNAIRELNDAVRRKPTYTDGYVMLGQACLSKQQLAAAEQAYRRALALAPGANDVRYQLGLTLLAAHRPNDALLVLSDAAQRDPANVAVQIGIGSAATAAGNYGLALQAFKKAAKLDPANPQVYTGLGIAALQLNHPDDAVSAFLKLVDLEPDNANALFELATAYKANGMEGEAQQSYERALKLSRPK